jgi:hypothetical protein
MEFFTVSTAQVVIVGCFVCFLALVLGTLYLLCQGALELIKCVPKPLTPEERRAFWRGALLAVVVGGLLIVLGFFLVLWVGLGSYTYLSKYLHKNYPGTTLYTPLFGN